MQSSESSQEAGQEVSDDCNVIVFDLAADDGQEELVSLARDLGYQNVKNIVLQRDRIVFENRQKIYSARFWI